MNLRWLSAAEDDVVAAIGTVDKDSRPQGAPRKGVLFHLNLMLLFLYFAISWIVFADNIDADARPRVEPSAVVGIVIAMVIFGAWLYGTRWLSTWSNRSGRSSQLRAWRQHLTALANGVEPEPVHRATFASLITGELRTAACAPRFVGPDVEFGNLRNRRHHELEWHYLAVTLPAPLPHLILTSSQLGALPKELPRAQIGQSLSLGNPFDRTFEVHAPRGYERDALFVLTPAVMAVLLDHAAAFHIEITGNTLVFFTAEVADFAEAESWRAVDSLLRGAVPAIVARAERYRDERVPEQASAHRLASFRAALETPGSTRVEPARRIGPGGQQLVQAAPFPIGARALWAVGQYLLLCLYTGAVVAALLAFGQAVSKLVSAFFGG